VVCDREASERGYCHGHYLRLLRTGDPQPDRPLRRAAIGACAVNECAEPLYAKGLCRIHYRRWRRTGDVQAEVPIRARSENGFVKHGYRYVRVPPALRHLTEGATNFAEHRLVVAQMLGRPLTADESVHHRNGDRLDNRPENLELWSCSQPSGQRVRDKVAHAVALLRRHAPELLR
jgi:hypothetical protein